MLQRKGKHEEAGDDGDLESGSSSFLHADTLTEGPGIGESRVLFEVYPSAVSLPSVMRRHQSPTLLAVALGLLFVVETVAAADVRVAVASNFATAIKEIAPVFEARFDHEVNLVFGSTGKHYAQVRNGAPLDVLLAADKLRPRLLEDEGMAVPGSRFTYARGRLVLWSPRAGYVDQQGRVLEGDDFRHLAIASPKLAPYGAAAREVLEVLGVWDRLQRRIVRGENIAQALQYVESGNAELGFIATSQLTPEHRQTGSLWMVPQDLYSPIEQQAVLLRDTPAAREFLAFLESDEAVGIIQRMGYEAP
jgi:molybdate transport system substrate-binding protein